MLAMPPSTPTDEKGQVLAVYNDGDLGIYLHEGAKSKSDIDKKYSSNNTSAGGIKISSILQEFSFVDGDALERGDIIPTGKINYNSSWAADNVNAVIWDMQGRGYYAANAKSSNSQQHYKYDIKHTALKEFGSVYHGSLLYDDVYASERCG